MIKKFLLFVSLIIFGFLSCKKQEKEDNTKFSVTLSQSGNSSVSVSWSAITLSNFKNILIYRSTSPIPDPVFGKSIDANLLLQTINDKTATSFIDSSFTMGSTGQIYYKLVLNFGNRFIVSDQLTAIFNAFAITLPPNANNVQYAIVKFPEINRLYVTNYSQSTLSVIDYSQKKLLTTITFPYSHPIYPVINMGNPEFFNSNGSSIFCYNAIDLSLKYSIAINVNVVDWTVKNNYLYVITSFAGSYKLKTFDLNSKSLLDDKALSIYAYGGNYDDVRLFSANNSNSLFLRYYSQYNSGGMYYYVTKVNTFSLVSKLPVDSLPLRPVAMNQDSTQNSFNYYNVNLSSDAKYLECNQNGDIYSLSDQSMHTIRTLNNFFVSPSFSADGKYIVGRPTTNSGKDIVDIFALPGFNLVTSVKSPNGPIFNSSAAADDFTDNDTLVSYNISQSGQFNQVTSTLTVFFKKIN